MRRIVARISIAGLLAAAATGAALLLPAWDSDRLHGETVAAEEEQPRDAWPGLRAYKDPETGRIGPPPQGARAEGAARTAARARPVPEPLPDGGWRLDMRYRFETVATKGSDGVVSFECAARKPVPAAER